MPTTYSTNLALSLPATGELSGTWGDVTNTNVGTLLEQAISGYATQAITDGADTTITIPNGATGVARNMFLELTGALTATRNLIVPANKKLYFIYNNTTGGFAVTVKVSGQTGVSVAAGAKVLLVVNGTDVVAATSYITASAAISPTLADAAGDMLVATAADTFGMIPAAATVAAHATTSNIWGAREILLSGGVVTFTDIADAPYVGAVAWVRANAAHIITDGAVFQVQGNANYTCAADDLLRFKAITVSTFEVTVFKADGTAIAAVSLASSSGNISGLTHSAAGGSADITFTAGNCVDSTTAVNIAPGALTKSTSAWTVGNNQGGKLSAAAIANSTQYYFYAIYRSDTGVSDIGFDVSATTPTMPANYTHSRLIGWARTDGAAQWVKSNSYERGGGAISYEWAVPPLDINLANTLTTSRRTDTLTVPTAFSVVATITVTAFDNAAGFIINVCNPDQTDAAPAFSASPLPQLVSAAGGAGVGAQFEVTTSSTGTIASRANLATVNEYYVSTVKFEWSRR